MITCSVHPEREAAGMCVSCGKPHCAECLIEIESKYYCKSCVAKQLSSDNQKRYASPVQEKSYSSEPPVKSKGTAIALCIFLGGIGAHRFYIGKIWSGLMMCILALCNLPSTYAISMALFADSINFGSSSFYLDMFNEFPILLVITLIHGIWCLFDLISILCNWQVDSHGRSLM